MYNKKVVVLIAFLVLVFAITIFMPLVSAAKADEVDIKVKDKLEEILNSEEFSQAQNKAGFFERLADNIKDILDYIKEKLGNYKRPENKPKRPIVGRQIGPWVNVFISISAIVSIFALIWVLLYKEFYKSRNLEAKHNNLLLKLINKPEELKLQISDYYKAGDYRQAFRFLYLALLVDLNRLNIIRIDKAKTNKQYLREVQRSGYKNYNDIRSFTSAFNDYWYGNKRLDRHEFDNWQEKYKSLLGEGGL